MRIRLLMDANIEERDIPRLAELLIDQPEAQVAIAYYGTIGARFVGAQPVYGLEELEGKSDHPTDHPSAGGAKL